MFEEELEKARVFAVQVVAHYRVAEKLVELMSILVAVPQGFVKRKRPLNVCRVSQKVKHFMAFDRQDGPPCEARVLF